MSEQKNDIPLVRLGDVAKWLRPFDVFEWDGTRFQFVEASEELVETHQGTVHCDQRVALISPRLELVPVDAIVKEGTPYACLAGSEWTDFEPPVMKDFANPIGACYQLIRDEPEQLPREVVAGPETLRAGDVVEFVRTRQGHDLSNRNHNTHVIDVRDDNAPACWETVAREYCVYDGTVVRLLSPANQDPPATVGPGGDYPSLAAAEAAGETRIEEAPEAVTEPAVPEKLQAAVEVCGWCREPFWAGRIVANKRNRFCADCEAFRVYPQDSWESNHPLRPAPDPHAHLTTQRWHLLDDPDATGIPEGN